MKVKSCTPYSYHVKQFFAVIIYIKAALWKVFFWKSTHSKEPNIGSRFPFVFELMAAKKDRKGVIFKKNWSTLILVTKYPWFMKIIHMKGVSTHFDWAQHWELQVSYWVWFIFTKNISKHDNRITFNYYQAFLLLHFGLFVWA